MASEDTRYTYQKMSWYPHLMPEDVAVWERFIDKNPDYYKSCRYDVPVGKVPEFVVRDPDPAASGMARLYKKKIDVLAEGNGRFDLVELKPVCSMSTVGQVLGYKHLYVRDEKPATEPRPVVICAEASPDVIEFAVTQGVQVLLA